MSPGCGRRGIDDPRPLVGVASDLVPASRGRVRHAAHDTYVRALRAAGARVVVLPATPSADHGVLASLDGVLLPGGSDLHPALWGESPGEGFLPSDPRRSAHDLALARKCLDLDLPLLAICLGLQTLNVACGGTLHTGIPEAPSRHHRDPDRDGNSLPRHVAVVEGGSLLSAALGIPVGGAVDVNSSHRWACDRLGGGVAVVARSQSDGVVEGAEVPGRQFCLGVQWHPEEDAATNSWSQRLFASFVGACRGEAPAC